jgi:hypothetical protein
MEFQQNVVMVINIILAHAVFISLLHIITIDGHSEITISLNMVTMNLRSSGKRVTLTSQFCRAICYHTLRSAFMQAIKWRLHRRSREVVATDAER